MSFPDNFQNPMDDNPLGQIAQEIQEIWREFSAKETSGIPQLKRNAENLGGVVEIKMTVEMTSDLGAEALRQIGMDQSMLLSPETLATTAEEEARLMGFSIQDVREIENQQSADRLQLIVSKIRETAPNLPLRIRNWICQYIGKKFPELGIDFEKATTVTLTTIYADEPWRVKVEEIINAAHKLPDPLPVLARILANMKRLEGLGGGDVVTQN